MRVIHCTNKLISKLKITVQPKYDDHENIGLGDWYSNVFDFGGKQHLVFSNMKTLVSFVIAKVSSKDLKNYQDLFMQHLRIVLSNLGLSDNIVDKIFLEYINTQIAKTDSKRYIGFMNDAVHQFKYTFDSDSPSMISSVEEFNKKVNEIPANFHNWRYPSEVLFDLVNEEYS